MPQAIKILLPGTKLEIVPTGYLSGPETVNSITSRADRDRAQSGSVRKRKRERQSFKSDGETLHHHQHSVKKVKQNDDAYTHFHPLQDYLQQGLDGTSFFVQPCSRCQIELGISFKVVFCGIKWVHDARHTSARVC